MSNASPSPTPASPDPSTPPTHPTHGRGIALHTQILIGLIVGAVSGLTLNTLSGGSTPAIERFITQVTEPLGQLFLRLLLMIVVPLVFASLVIGVANIGDFRRLGRVGLKSLSYCLAISLISVGLGLTLVNTIQPGKRISAETAQGLEKRYAADATKKIQDVQKTTNPDAPLLQFIKTLIPANPVTAVASETPNLLHWMFFALAIGAGATLVPSQKIAPLIDALEGVNAIAGKLIELIMKAAPYAVAFLVFSNTARFGLDLFVALGWYVFTVLAGLGIHMFVVYSIFLLWLTRISPIEFFRRTRTVMLTAFSTSSSVATLPTTLQVSEKEIGVPSEINSFVLTVGATANQNGTALYEGVTVLFLAQLAGLDLPLSQQLLVAGMAILGSIGTAGLPSASIPFVVVVLAQIGVNPALIAIILGVDRLLDMCRTVVNVIGDVTAAAFVARSEGFPLLPKRTTD